jgi:hypothetical protein
MISSTVVIGVSGQRLVTRVEASPSPFCGTSLRCARRGAPPADSSTVKASALRTYQQGLKTALDRGNNNLNFVQAGPITCPTPTFN